MTLRLSLCKVRKEKTMTRPQERSGGRQKKVQTERKRVPLKKAISHDWEKLREHVSKLTEGLEHSCDCAACKETLSHLYGKAVALRGVLKHVRHTR